MPRPTMHSGIAAGPTTLRDNTGKLVGSTVAEEGESVWSILARIYRMKDRPN